MPEFDFLRNEQPLNPSSHCLSPEEIACAVSDPAEQSSRLLDHISTCAWCAKRVQMMIEVGQVQLTTDEQSLLDSSAPCEPGTAEQDPRNRSGRGWGRHWFGIAAAVLLTTVGIGSWLYWNQPTRKMSRLLAQAYTSQRTFDWRLPDDGWSSRSLSRGCCRYPAAGLGRSRIPLAAFREFVAARD